MYAKIEIQWSSMKSSGFFSDLEIFRWKKYYFKFSSFFLSIKLRRAVDAELVLRSIHSIFPVFMQNTVNYRIVFLDSKNCKITANYVHAFIIDINVNYSLASLSIFTASFHLIDIVYINM